MGTLARHPEWAALALSGLVLFCLRIPFTPATLDDLDGVNFSLAAQDYDPAAYRPHPPGYPVFILFVKLSHVFFASDATALALLSVVFGSLSVIPLYFLMRELTSRSGAALACLFTLACPLVWFNSVRPMSDLTGFFAVLAGQCLLLKGARGMERNEDEAGRYWLLGVIVSGLAVGVRSQAVLLVGPILLFGWVRQPRIRWSSAAWLAASVAAWAVPMLYLSGGFSRYCESLTLLLTDAIRVEPLLSGPTIRRAVFAAWDVVGSPWRTAWLALPVLLSAAVGAIVWTFSDRRALAWALLLFLPYALYHYLLQMTATIRYAIPIVPLVALLAAVPLVQRRIPRLVTVMMAVAFAAVSGLWTWPAMAAYHRSSSPAAEALAHLREHAAVPSEFVVSGHQVFERYLSTLQPEFTVLPSVPRKPLQRVLGYWRQGGRKSVLFLKNPMRTSLLLVGRDTQTSLGRWSWPAVVEPLMKGERPSRVELVRLDPPRWFCESGFLVTLEAGPSEEVAAEEHRAYVLTGTRQAVVIASGSVASADETAVTLHVGGTVHEDWRLKGDFVLRTLVDPPPTSSYVPFLFVSPAPVRFTDFWVEPYDGPVIRPARGFHSAERDSQARLFRWMGPKAEAVAYMPGREARLRIVGRIPVKYYRLPVTMSLRWNGTKLASFAITREDFTFDTVVSRPAGAEPWGTLTLNSSHRFVPHDWQKNGDRRVLAAQIYRLELGPSPLASVSEPTGSPQGGR